MRPQRPDLRAVPPPPPDERPSLPVAVETGFLVYVRDPNLMPVTLALFGHVAILITGLLLAVWRSASWLAGGALLVLAAATVSLVVIELRQAGRPSRAGVVFVGTWMLGLAVAWLAERTGFL
jgi:hypothetical protein